MAVHEFVNQIRALIINLVGIVDFFSHFLLLLCSKFMPSDWLVCGLSNYIFSNFDVVSIRSQKGYQSSSQHLLRILIVSRSHTMSNTLYWYASYFILIPESGISEWLDTLLCLCVCSSYTGEVQLWYNWSDRSPRRDFETSYGVNRWDSRKGPIKW